MDFDDEVRRAHADASPAPAPRALPLPEWHQKLVRALQDAKQPTVQVYDRSTSTRKASLADNLGFKVKKVFLSSADNVVEHHYVARGSAWILQADIPDSEAGKRSASLCVLQDDLATVVSWAEGSPRIEYSPAMMTRSSCWVTLTGLPKTGGWVISGSARSSRVGDDQVAVGARIYAALARGSILRQENFGALGVR